MLIATPASEAAIHYSFVRGKAAPSSMPSPTSSPSKELELEERAIVAAFQGILERTPEGREEKFLFQFFSEVLPAEHREYYVQHVLVTADSALKICLETANQCGPQWILHRRSRITGSTCYGIYTYTQNKNPNWNQKIDSLINGTFTGNADTRHGQQCEGKARTIYSTVTGCQVTQLGFVIHPNASWLGFSPDGIASVNGEPFLLEIKTTKVARSVTAFEALKSCNFISFENGIPNLKKRHKYYGQVQLGMEILKVKKCHLIVFADFDQTLVIITVDKDESFIGEMIPALGNVYYDIMLPQLVKEKK